MLLSGSYINWAPFTREFNSGIEDTSLYVLDGPVKSLRLTTFSRVEVDSHPLKVLCVIERVLDVAFLATGELITR